MEMNDAPKNVDPAVCAGNHAFEKETILGAGTLDDICTRCGANRSRQTGEIFE